jgi:adenylosuccinate synthase
MTRNNDIIIGLGFGDEGKGTITDYLCTLEEVNAVVRFSGGPQTAHNVVTENGLHHTFAQFGSGTFRGVKTLLSRYMLVNPFNMVAEANDLWDKTDTDPLLRTYISSSALLITPLHVAVNKLREERRGAKAHGSVGEGVGESRYYQIQHPVLAPVVKDLKNLGFLQAKLNEYRIWAEHTFGVPLEAPTTDELMDSYVRLQNDRPINIVSEKFITDEIRRGYNVFEGSQGILLDEAHGFHPHTTWSDTTPHKAQQLLAEAGSDKGNVIGITRTYQTRHGFGPFPSEDLTEDAHTRYPENHNAFGRWQGAWRAGILDLTLLDYAVKVAGGIDEIAVTHLDVPVSEVITEYPAYARIEPVEKKDLAYQEKLTGELNSSTGTGVLKKVKNEKELIGLIEKTVSAKATIKSSGARSDQKTNTRK